MFQTGQHTVGVILRVSSRLGWAWVGSFTHTNAAQSIPYKSQRCTFAHHVDCAVAAKQRLLASASSIMEAITEDLERPSIGTSPTNVSICAAPWPTNAPTLEINTDSPNSMALRRSQFRSLVQPSRSCRFERSKSGMCSRSRSIAHTLLLNLLAGLTYSKGVALLNQLVDLFLQNFHR